MSTAKRKQWVAIWNSVHSETGDEARAFSTANGVLKRRKETDNMPQQLLLSAKALAELESLVPSVKAGSVPFTAKHSFEHIAGQIHHKLNDHPRTHTLSGDYHAILGTYPDHVLVNSYTWDGEGDAVHDIPYDYDEDDPNGEGPLTLKTDDATKQSVALEPMDDDEDDASTMGKDFDSGLKAELDSGKGSPKRSKLPKSAFAYVDDDGVGHFPIQDAAHVRNALARLNQSPYGDKARKRVMAAARKFGIKVSSSGAGGGSKAVSVSVPAAPSSIWERIKSVLDFSNHDAEGSTMPALTLVSVKSGRDQGRMRFFAAYTNCYGPDRHKEFISTAAHKEFVAWATKSNQFPEMWLWHTKGTKWGQVDSLDLMDGVVVASGLVEPGKEPLAERLAAKGKDLGFSHGFFGLRSKDGIWNLVRTFEVTALPRVNAANQWTSALELFNAKEEDLALAPNKREFFLASGMTADQLATVEKEQDAFVQNLKAIGLEYKESSVADVPDAHVLVQSLTATQTAIGQLAGVTKEVKDALTTLSERVDKQEKDFEKAVNDGVTKVMSARSQPGGGFRASADPSTVSNPDTPEARAVLDQANKAAGSDWLLDQMMADFGRNGFSPNASPAGAAAGA